MKTAVGLWRYCVMLFFIVACLVTAYTVFRFSKKETQLRLIRFYSRNVLKGAGVKISVESNPNAFKVTDAQKNLGLTIVSNHVSWLDIFAIDSVIPSRFIAKAEIARWPLMGLIAKQIGTLFVNRGRKSAILQINKDITKALEEGDNVALFAEGTTTFGNELLPLKSNFLSPAATLGSLIQPIIISYTSLGLPTKRIAFSGNITLFQCLWKVVTTEDAGVTVHFLNPVSTEKANRREAAIECEKEMKKKLKEIWGSEFKETDLEAAKKLQEAIKNG